MLPSWKAQCPRSICERGAMVGRRFWEAQGKSLRDKIEIKRKDGGFSKGL